MFGRGGIGSESRSAGEKASPKRTAALMPEARSYPVVDLFAGPGGLGEGFASFLDDRGKRKFNCAIAIEREEFSHQTLLLRHFLRRFRDDEIPEDYYSFLSGELELSQLFSRYPAEAREAQLSALRISLGPDSHDLVRRLVRQRINHSERWALVGGPPCQAYSLVGRSRMMNGPEFENDERHTLYREYLKVVTDHRPPVFVMENVKGLLSATIDGKSTITRIVRDLARPGRAFRNGPKNLSYRLYGLSCDGQVEGEVDPRQFVVEAEKHGIPQARHRIFILGIRSDLKIRPSVLKKITPPTVRETIGNLPQLRSSLSREADSTAAWQAEIRQISKLNIRGQLNGFEYALPVASRMSPDRLINFSTPSQCSSTRYPKRVSQHEALRSLHDSRLTTLTAHEARAHMGSDLRRYFYAAVFAETTGRSPRLADFPRSLLPNHQNVETGRVGKMFSDRFRVQLADSVSTTITSHISKDGHYFIHYDPNQCRSFTVREAARLQTFPDNYFFAGPRTAQYHQVGNAVPPYLARQIAEVVAEILDSMKVNK
jgi:DNA (cytosine-5)-methyltransferase 1